MGGSLGDAVVEVRADARTLDGDLHKAETKIGKFVSKANQTLGTLGAVGGVAAIAGVSAALIDAAQKAADFGETMSKVTAVFGKDSKKITDFADKMAQKFGLVKSTTIDGATSFGLLGKSVGFSASQAADFGVELTQMAADLESFLNVPFDDVLLKLRSGLSGEAEPLRAFGVFLSEDAVQAEALRIGLVKTAAAAKHLTEAQKVRARFSAIKNTASIKDALGDLERTKDSDKNQQRKFFGDLENFKVDFGKNVIGSLTEAIKLARELGGALDSALGGSGTAESGGEGLKAGVAGLRVAIKDPKKAALAGLLGLNAFGGNETGRALLQDQADAQAGVKKGPLGLNAQEIRERDAEIKRRIGVAKVDSKIEPILSPAAQRNAQVVKEAAQRKEREKFQAEQQAAAQKQFNRGLIKTAINTAVGIGGALLGDRPEALAGRAAINNVAGLLGRPAATLLLGASGAIGGVRNQLEKPKEEIKQAAVLSGAGEFSNYAQVAALEQNYQKEIAAHGKDTVEKLGNVVDAVKDVGKKLAARAVAVLAPSGNPS